MKVKTAGGYLMFECPGCATGDLQKRGVISARHRIKIDGGPWNWNGNAAAPTIDGSVLMTYDYGDPPTVFRCHSLIADGQIQFLPDCTHSMAGQTVPLPEIADA